MAYSELIKNFEKIRSYMREFYIYGFKSRTEYDTKSSRSYDNERRRIESWLGDYMKFTQTTEGKNLFISVDSRVTRHNPFYKAWKAKSFTDGDISLHFVLFDILCSPEVKKTLAELVEEIDGYFSEFENPMTFDESTIRKKLKEYSRLGIIRTEKEGRKVFYSRTESRDLSQLSDILDFFSEAAPCGVIGSFLLDKQKPHRNIFTFKHHYITQAIDSDILAELFSAMGEKRFVTAENLGRHSEGVKTLLLVPLKIYISSQNGRQNLIAWNVSAKRLCSYRVDYLSKIKPGEVCPEFEELREKLAQAEPYMWGVNCHSSLKRLEHVDFTVRISEDEQFIVGRLEREKRCGKVEKIDDFHYRYSADVFDTNEMLPWIRTFISRITEMNFSNRTVENRFKNDLEEMYRMYGLEDE